MGCFLFIRARILFHSGVVGHTDGEMTVVKGEEFIQFPRRGVAWHTEPNGAAPG